MIGWYVNAGFDSSLGDQLDIIRTAIDDLLVSCGHVTRDIIDSSRGVQTADIDTTAAERAVDNAEKALQEADRLLTTDGARALQDAINAQRQFGHQSDRMTRIATEARDIADRLLTTHPSSLV